MSSLVVVLSELVVRGETRKCTKTRADFRLLVWRSRDTLAQRGLLPGVQARIDGHRHRHGSRVTPELFDRGDDSRSLL
jgi:hypothetical protein